MATESKDKETIYFAIDIEKAGCQFKHPIVSIGFCVGDDQGKVFVKDKINFNVEWPKKMICLGLNPDGTEKPLAIDLCTDFEPRCWDQFWSKQSAELVARLKKDAVDKEKGARMFSKLLDDVERKFDPLHSEIVFLSDNPEYDIGAVNHLLEEQLGRRPIRFASVGDYRSVINPDDVIDAFPKRLIAHSLKVDVEDKSVHDHDPANDAHRIYLKQLLVNRIMKPFHSHFETFESVGAILDAATAHEIHEAMRSEEVEEEASDSQMSQKED